MIFLALENRSDHVIPGASGKDHARPMVWQKSFRTLSFAILPFLMVACQSNVEKAQQYASKAQGLSDAGDVRGALEAINNALALRDDRPEYFLLLGSIKLRAGDVGGAYDAFKRAVELDSTNVQALSYVANLGLQLGQAADAGDAADRLLALDPNTLVALQVKGLIALNNEHYDEANAFADKMLAISPSDEAGTIVRVRALAKSGNYQQASEQLDKAMLVVGKSPALLITKLNFHRIQKQPDQMLAVLDELITGSKNPSPALEMDRILILYKLGKTERARQLALDFMAKGAPNADYYRTIRQIWQEYDAQPVTVSTLTEERDWSDPLAVNAVGRYLLWQGQPQTAAALVAKVKPELQATNMSIAARAQDALGKSVQARQSVAAILKTAPDDVDALILHAQFEQKDGHANAALEAGQKAISVDPLDPEAYVVLAALNKAGGQNWRARQVFEDGIKQLPQDFLLIEKYTQFLHLLGDKDRAVSVARSFARAMPSSVKAWMIYLAECRLIDDAACIADAEKGRQSAQSIFRVDPAPGVRTDRGLLGEF